MNGCRVSRLCSCVSRLCSCGCRALARAVALAGLLAVALAPLGGRAQAQDFTERRALVRGSHARLIPPSAVQRVANGDTEVLEVDLIDSGEVLVLGKSEGQAGLTLWLAGGAVRQYLFQVQPDLSVLQGALREIHESLRAEAAPDRAAVVLRGDVPDLSYSVAAEATARAYLEAGRSTRGASEPVLGSAPQPGEVPDAAQVDGASAAREGLERPGGAGRRSRAAVVNLIRVRTLPELLERRMERTLRELAGSELRVRRLARGDLPGPEDSFVIEGRVADQRMLTRALSVAARLLGADGEALATSMRVLADEGGALRGAPAPEGEAQGSTLSGFDVSGVSFGRTRLGNALERNVGRASALELLDGRLLSFVTVDDLPQVRVAVRLYEVSRTRLRSWDPALDLVSGNVSRPALLPTLAGLRVEGPGSAQIGGSGQSELQGALSLLGGGLVSQLQIAGARYAIDLLFDELAERGIARSLAHPAVTVLAGERATIQVGGEIPVPTSIANAAGGQILNTISFVPFGVQLGIRPQVGPGGRITLDLSPQVVQPDPELTAAVRVASGTSPGTTAFASRGLVTTARLADGEALAVAGLVSRQTTDSQAYTPWLSRIPLLGSLTESQRESDEDVELVFVVSPSIVRERDPRVGLWSFPDAAEILDRAPGAGGSPAP